MISFGYFPVIHRAASRAVLAAALLLGPSTAALAQGAAGAAPTPPSAPARTSAGPIPAPPAPTGVMGAGTESRMWADPPAPLAPSSTVPHWMWNRCALRKSR